MKISSAILLVTLALLLVAMFASNVILKKEYDKLDKSDTYWNYGKILEQPFKYVKVNGGNITHIAFEPSQKPSVRVFKNWEGYENKVVKAFVKNDTLYLTFPNTVTNPNEKRYLGWNTMVRIFSPELLSVDGHDTNFGLFKLKQKNISINLSGKSKLEVESYLHNLDSLHVTQSDSSEVVFEMSPDLMGKGASDQETAGLQGQAPMPAAAVASNPQQMVQVPPVQSNSWEAMYVKTVDANVQGASLLDVGHAQIRDLRLTISDTSGIILSGGSLRKFKK